MCPSSTSVDRPSKKSPRKRKHRAVNRPRKWVESDGGVSLAIEALEVAEDALDDQEARDEEMKDDCVEEVEKNMVRLCLNAQHRTWEAVSTSDEQAALLSRAVAIAKHLEQKWPQVSQSSRDETSARTYELERQRRLAFGRLSLSSCTATELEENDDEYAIGSKKHDQQHLLQGVEWSNLQSEKSDLILAALAHDERSGVYRYEDCIEAIRQRCENAVRRAYQTAKCEIYGSRRSGLAHRESDVDICALIDAPEVETCEEALDAACQQEPEVRAVLDALCRTLDKLRSKQAYAVKSCLEIAGFEHVLAIPWARVPVVKATDPKSALTIDVVVNNRCALLNSKLLRRFAQSHECARTLILLVKLWAKARRVDDAASGTLSSYAHALLAIFSLQTAGLLPAAEAFIQEDGTILPLPADTKSNNIRADKCGLTTLLRNYFRCLASIDVMAYAVSVRLGRLIPKTEWLSAVGRTRDPLGWRISIEDPVQHVNSSRPRDLGDVLNSRGEKAFRDELHRALRLIDVNDWKTLFQPDLSLDNSKTDATPPPPPPLNTKARLSTRQTSHKLSSNQSAQRRGGRSSAGRASGRGYRGRSCGQDIKRSNGIASTSTTSNARPQSQHGNPSVSTSKVKNSQKQRHDRRSKRSNFSYVPA